MDRFEKHIKENRLRLDTEDLDASVWEGINQSFSVYKKRKIWRTVSVAASIVIVLSFGILQLAKEQTPKPTSVFAGFSEEMEEKELEYINLVNSQIKNIKGLTIPAEHEKRFEGFVEQLHIIDQQYEVYKSEIKENGYNDELIQQVIYNYQLKLSVLKMLQKEIEKFNELTKNTSHGSTKIKI